MESTKQKSDFVKGIFDYYGIRFERKEIANSEAPYIDYFANRNKMKASDFIVLKYEILFEDLTMKNFWFYDVSPDSDVERTETIYCEFFEIIFEYDLYSDLTNEQIDFIIGNFQMDIDQAFKLSSTKILNSIDIK